MIIYFAVFSDSRDSTHESGQSLYSSSDPEQRFYPGRQMRRRRRPGRNLEYLEYLRACRQLWTRRYMNGFNPLNSTNLFWYRLVHPLHHGQYIQAAAQRVITCVYSSASPTRATFSSACRNCSNASISRSPRRAPRVSTSLEGSSTQRYLRKKEEGRRKG